LWRASLIIHVATVFFTQDYESSVECFVKNGADVDEKLSHLQPVVVLETLNWAQYVSLGQMCNIIFNKNKFVVIKALTNIASL